MKSQVRSLFGFLCLVLTPALAQAQLCGEAIWWHDGLTQAQRDANILRVAQSYPDGKFVGVECKQWVRDVVSIASKKSVVVPATSGYEWIWWPSPDVEALFCDRWDGVPWPPGQILQAQVRAKSGGTLPHTMIVVSANAWGVTVIESNWQGDQKVRRRTCSWVDFKRSILHYTLYRVK